MRGLWKLLPTVLGAGLLAAAQAPRALAQAAPPPAPAPSADPHAGHDMSAMGDMAGRDHSAMTGMDHGGMSDMPGMAGMDMGGMTGALASYPMTRDASGTAWQPDSSPMLGIMGKAGGWPTMLHGYGTLVYDDQGGRRGDDKAFFESMLMGMVQRPLAGGTLTLRGMFSLDPLMGKRGYPLLLGTGETADGRTPLVDRQHPHDFAMEIAAAYSRRLAGNLSGFLYVGWPGEPALGPATFMHRFSGVVNPEAPIGHHWLDSTHVTFGVATVGVVYGNVKLEGSSFTGREPNQNRWDLDHPRFDSWSLRATWNPSPDWSMQVSRGHLVSPEQLAPDENEDRTTASATWNRKLAWRGRAGDAQATFAWGRDEIDRHQPTDAFLLDAAIQLGADTVFARAERVDKDELFADQPASLLAGRVFTTGKLSVGYFRTLPVRSHLGVDIGGLVSRYDLPRALDAAYGRDPTSFMLFARLMLR